IYEWNKAFEKAGFSNAIIVMQQGDKDDIDPEDIRYNFCCLSTSNAGFAMGPSRVNPYTGQILDADIIFDADFLTSWKQEYENMTPKTLTMLTTGTVEESVQEKAARLFTPKMARYGECQLNHGMAMQ